MTPSNLLLTVKVWQKTSSVNERALGESLSPICTCFQLLLISLNMLRRKKLQAQISSCKRGQLDAGAKNEQIRGYELNPPSAPHPPKKDADACMFGLVRRGCKCQREEAVGRVRLGLWLWFLKNKIKKPPEEFIREQKELSKSAMWQTLVFYMILELSGAAAFLSKQLGARSNLCSSRKVEHLLTHFPKWYSFSCQCVWLLHYKIFFVSLFVLFIYGNCLFYINAVVAAE